VSLLLAALVALLGGQPGARVIVHIDHLQVVRGVVTLEDADGMHIKTLEGEDVLVDPATAFSVVRLFDVDAPESVIVHMRDGRRIRGELHADDWGHVKLDVHGVRLTLSRNDVAFVRKAPDIEALYRSSRAAIKDDDEHGRMALARWLVGQRAWALAELELADIVIRFDNIEAARLLPRARAQAAVAVTVDKPAKPDAPKTDNANNASDGSPTVPVDPPRPTEPEPPALPKPREAGPSANVGLPPLPDPTLVQLVRVMELDPTNPPIIRVTDATRRRLHLGWGGSRRLPDTPEALQELLALPHAEALRLLFDLRARPLYGEVQVPEIPPSLKRFNDDVHDSWLTSRCGTSACHGSPDAGRFRLYYSSRINDRLRTANLLQLETTTLDGEKLLDWTTPANSLLIQHALPRASASNPHPRTRGWRPVLNGDRLEATLRWMRSMRTPRPKHAWPPEQAWPPGQDDQILPPPAATQAQ